MHKLATAVILAAALAAALAGCATLTGRTAGEIVDDATITTAINAKIVGEPDLHYLKIDVNTTRGDVVLTGFVPSREAEEKLVELARGIRGVKSVKSLLELQKQ